MSTGKSPPSAADVPVSHSPEQACKASLYTEDRNVAAVTNLTTVGAHSTHGKNNETNNNKNKNQHPSPNDSVFPLEDQHDGTGSSNTQHTEADLGDSRRKPHDSYPTHTPPSRPLSSLLMASNSFSPPLPRKRVSTSLTQNTDAALPSPSPVSRRMWMHFPEHEIHVASPPTHPAEKSAEAEFVRVTRTRGLTGVMHGPLVPPSPSEVLTLVVPQPNLCARAPAEEKLSSEVPHTVKPDEDQAVRSVSSAKSTLSNAATGAQGDVIPKMQPASSSILPSSTITVSMLPPRSPTRPPPPPPPACPSSFQLDDAATAVVAAERKVSSPSPTRQEEFFRSTSSRHKLPADAKAPTGFLSYFAISANDRGEEKEAVISFQPPPASLSLTRPRLNQVIASRRFSRQVSLSFDYGEDDKAAASTANSDSVPPHGLSPPSVVPSDTQSFTLPTAPLHSDFFWRGRSTRVDGRSTTSSANSPQRQDIESLPPPRSTSIILTERRMSLTGISFQPSMPAMLESQGRLEGYGSNNNTVRRGEDTSLQTAHLLCYQTPRTRSAVYSTTALGLRGAQHSRYSVDAAALVDSATPYPRSLSSHSVRHEFSMRNAKNNKNNSCTHTGAILSNVKPPLLPHLNPLLYSPSSTPRLRSSQSRLTPVPIRASTCSESSEGAPGDAGGISTKGEVARAARLHSISMDDFSPFAHAVTPLVFPPSGHCNHHQQHQHSQSALPSIQTTPRVAAVAGGAREKRQGTESTEDIEAALLNNSGRRRSTPRQSRVSFSIPRNPQAADKNSGEDSEERVADNSIYSFVPESSENADHPSLTPPPPPWTPAEALYWMSSRLTRQEALEIRRYDRVYYCGPAVPPRTACGVTEVVIASPQEYGESSADCSLCPDSGRETCEWLHVSTTTNSTSVAAVTTAMRSSSPSPASYFPITLGMHISFRYEVAEVLGFGTFSVVVRAIDHAAPPLSPERHCALKLVRKEALYQQAALDEWEVYERIKASCTAFETGCNDEDTLHNESSPPHHRLCPFPFPFRPSSSSSFSFTCRLTSSDQRTLLIASVLTPRTRFEFHGYLVIVFPLLGFNVRDVLELEREREETTAARVLLEDNKAPQEDQSRSHHQPLVSPAGQTNPADNPADASSMPTATSSSSSFPPLITASILAQVVYALAFLHLKAHLLHGDLKPENVVFVDRTLSQGTAEDSVNRDSGIAHLTSRTPSHSKSMGNAHQQGAHEHRKTIADDREMLVPETATEGEDEAIAPPIEASGLHDATSPTSSPVYWLRGCNAEGNNKSSAEEEHKDLGERGERQGVDSLPGSSSEGNNTKGIPSPTTTPMSRDLQASSHSIVDARHTSSRQTPGLTASRTGTLPSSPHLARPTDTMTLYGGRSDGAAVMTATATHNSAEDSPNRAAHFSRHRRSYHDSCSNSSNNSRSSAPSELYGTSSVSFWSTSSRVAVIDLGHAKPLAPGQTGAAFPLQSPSYRAPEMALRLPYTTAIDMWSLGCVLYELRTGHVLFPSASDDASMLATAVSTLGMPDTNFLSMVKLCWKEYKKRKAGGALPSRSNSVAGCGTFLSVYLTEHEVAEQDDERGAATTAASLYNNNNNNNNNNNDNDDDTRPVLLLSAEEAAVEQCWRSFIQVLNTTAGQQRAHNEQRRRQSAPTCGSGNVTITASLSKAISAASTPSSVEKVKEATTLCKTTWETPAQCALLSNLFPEGQANTEEQTFNLWVADSYCRPSTSAPSTLTQPPPSLSHDRVRKSANPLQRPDYVWVDFFLGCLYWDAADRLTSAEAQRHPFIATHFTSARTVNKDVEVEEKEAAGAADLPPHCSGVYYLQHHPLTAHLFSTPSSSQRASGRRCSSREWDQQESSQSQLTMSRRRPGGYLPLLSLAPTAIVPFELPSNKRTAPSAHAWEEHQQLQQQQQHYLPVTEEVYFENDGCLTPSGQRVSVFCERSPSQGEEGTHVCASGNTTTPFQFEFHENDMCASKYGSNLVSPDRITALEDGEREDATGDHLQQQAEESEVMVLRLD